MRRPQGNREQLPTFRAVQGEIDSFSQERRPFRAIWHGEPPIASALVVARARVAAIQKRTRRSYACTRYSGAFVSGCPALLSTTATRTASRIEQLIGNNTLGWEVRPRGGEHHQAGRSGCSCNVPPCDEPAPRKKPARCDTCRLIEHPLAPQLVPENPPELQEALERFKSKACTDSRA